MIEIGKFLDLLVSSPMLGFLAFILICAIFYTIKMALYLLPKMIIRGMNIRSHGWPPPYLDADGDFKPDEKSAYLEEPEDPEDPEDPHR